MWIVCQCGLYGHKQLANSFPMIPIMHHFDLGNASEILAKSGCTLQNHGIITCFPHNSIRSFVVVVVAVVVVVFVVVNMYE